jgi:ubiquinone/menaquinone biosynthesis C-methylase UbiE
MTQDSDTVKSCCAKFYENSMIAGFLNGNFHPGGEDLTLHLGKLLELKESDNVLDVACGRGASAVPLAREFGCRITGVDLSEKNINLAKSGAEEAHLSERLEFVLGDAEKLKFEDATFTAVLCECALCTFPDKKTAVNEMYRVLAKGGRVGITDVVIEDELPESLKNILSHLLCISGALSRKGYEDLLHESGFEDIHYEDCTETISDMIEKVQRLIPTLDMIAGLFDLKSVLGISADEAKDLIETAVGEVEKGNIGYGLFYAK